MNHGEAELFRRRLLSSGGENQQTDPGNADVNVIFTCVVIQETEKRMLKKIRELKKIGTPIIISGCLVTSLPDKAKEIASDALLIPPRELGSLTLEKIVEWIASHSGGEEVEGDGNNVGRDSTDTCDETVEGETKKKRERARFRNSEIFRSPSLEREDRATFIVPISQGCLGNCAYCLTKQARGVLQSYPPDHIVEMVTGAVKAGMKEIQLTSQDTGIYGRDIGSSLPELLELISGISGEFRVRVGMMNPTGMKPILKELIEAYRSEKVFKFLHMPIQSGDNEVLKRMRRGYAIEEAKEIIEDFRRAMPELTLSTDIITGFPGEDEDAFQRSLNAVRDIQPDLVNITRYSERPGTEAVDLGNKVHGRVSKDRSRMTTELRFRISAEKNSRFVGRELNVLVTEQGKGESVICRDDNYRTVVVKHYLPVGDRYDVRIVDSTDVYLLGELINV